MAEREGGGAVEVVEKQILEEKPRFGRGVGEQRTSGMVADPVVTLVLQRSEWVV